MKMILINGKKRAGKDFTAILLREELSRQGYSSEIMSFAKPIKDIISMTLSISLDELDELKNQDKSVYLRDKQQCMGVPQYQKFISFRGILQRFGTEAMKKYFGEDVWTKLLISEAEKLDVDYIIIPDFRFISEYDWFFNNMDTRSKFQNIHSIKIRNDVVDNASSDTHASENELNNFDFDIIIDNTPIGDNEYVDLGLVIKNVVEEINR